MKVIAKTAFATRTQSFIAGQIYEVSEAEFKDFGSLVAPANKSDIKSEVKEEPKKESVVDKTETTEKPKKKGK